MNKLIKKAAIIAMSEVLTFSMMPSISAKAAKKKLFVNKVYDTTTQVKGKTKKKYQVRVIIGKQTYKANASKTGNFSVKIPKQTAGESLIVKTYRKSGRRWKYYTKKKVSILAKTISVKKFSKSSKYIKGYARPKYKIRLTMNGKTYTKKAGSKTGYFAVKMKKAAGNATGTIKLYDTKGKYVKTYKIKAESDYTQNGKPYNGKVPGLSDPINVEDFNNRLNSTNTFKDNSIYYRYDITKSFSDVCSGYGRGSCGYISTYLGRSNNEESMWFTAKNGVTLYYMTFESGDLRNTPIPGPSNKAEIIKSGETVQIDPKFKDAEGHISRLAIKIVGYKNGKPVIMVSELL